MNKSELKQLEYDINSSKKNSDEKISGRYTSK